MHENNGNGARLQLSVVGVRLQTVPTSPEPTGGPPFGASGHRNCDQPLSLLFFESALSPSRPLKLRLPEGASYSSSLVREMIQVDASNGFEHLIPEGANFVEVSMPSAVMHVYKQAYESHPNVANIPPMRIVERGTIQHLDAIRKGGVVFVKEDPLKPTVIDEKVPDIIKVLCQGSMNTK